jgi:Glycosyltransferase 61
MKTNERNLWPRRQGIFGIVLFLLTARHLIVSMTMTTTDEPMPPGPFYGNESQVNGSKFTRQTIASNKTKFSGSKITRLSMGVELFENVCIVFGAEQKNAAVHSYTADARNMESTLGTRTLMDDFHRTQGRPLEMWHKDTSKFPLIKTDVLFTPTLYGNPGHCISDYMMPLIRDRFERQTLKKLEKGIPEYPNWVRMHRKLLPYDPKIYCNQLLIAAGFIAPEGFISENHVCFERLFIAATAQQRFPLNQELMPIAKYELQVTKYKSSLLPSAADLTGPEYPREALVEFRQTLWQNMNLRGDPWTDQQTKVVDKVGPRILFYNRFGSRQRPWKNSHEVADILRQGYIVNIDVMGQEWNSLNFTQQAWLYNNYSHIVTVHGAHLANLIFSRPGTQVIEIAPVGYKKLRLNESLKHREEAKDQRDWYGPLGWFSSFTRQVGIEHFMLHAEDHIRTLRDASSGMDINSTRAVNCIVSRFGLKPRENHTFTQSPTL